MQFEGATPNSFETTLRVDDPSQDNVITLPDASGTLITSGDTNTVTQTMIADNAWCSGIVIGDALPNWQDLELTRLTSKLYWNNETPQDAMINDANPLVSLSWVANLLVAQGKTIPAESVIITGSVIKTRAPLIGDKIIYDVGGLSKVEINII
jgi:2-keto-4-pentenoate hydratase